MEKYSFFIFGATGSVGTMIFDIIEKSEKNDFSFYLLTANKISDKLISLINKYYPKNLFLFDNKENKEIDKFIREREQQNNKEHSLYYKKGKFPNVILNENDFIKFIVESFKLVNDKKNKTKRVFLNSIMGINGFIPTIVNFFDDEIIGASANKESLVILGELLKNINYIKKISEIIFPLDSEHFSLYKLFNIVKNCDDIKNIIITASGGIFYQKLIEGFKFEELKNIKLEDLLKHPNWKMGKRITIDSSTGLNKCFEFIEAIYLYNIEKEKIKIGVSKSSFIHAALVDKTESIYIDASHPDMHQSINYFFNKVLGIKTNYNYKELDNYFIDYKLENYDFSFFKITDYVMKNYNPYNFFGTKIILLNEILQDKLFDGQIELYEFIEVFINILKNIEKQEIFDENIKKDFNKLVLLKNEKSANFENRLISFIINLFDSINSYRIKIKNLL
jgi:1-deoxy-D-xylulose-5-phosphate reductoisomerase